MMIIIGMDFKEGIYAVYKPKGPTSHDIVERIRKLVNGGKKGGKRIKVGHAGTLDPLAKGVLVIGIGREATKNLKGAVQAEKEYIAEITFGVESATDDAEGKIKAVKPKPRAVPPAIGDIEEALTDFTGLIKQMPPVYSAVKVRGREAYKYARKGGQVKLMSRNVEIKEIEIIEYRWPVLKIRVITGPGAYIRALARDIGRKLRAGAYLSGLERVRGGRYTKELAIRL